VESDSAEDAGLSHDVIRDHWQLSVGLNDYGFVASIYLSVLFHYPSS
jgi:hypothetical protein